MNTLKRLKFDLEDSVAEIGIINNRLLKLQFFTYDN
jgi:hypothetical protein